MQIKLISVGARNPEWLEAGINEYCQRIKGNWQFQHLRLAQVRRSRNTTAVQCRLREGRSIIQELSTDDYPILLDERGTMLSTNKWCTQLQKIANSSKHPAFIIGGTDGVSEDVRKSAAATWSLSSLTLAHGLAQLVFVEQLYRTYTLTTNHPYHRPGTAPIPPTA